MTDGIAKSAMHSGNVQTILANQSVVYLISCGFSNLSNLELVLKLLYGDERLNFESNKIIIKATLDFIESSKRFS